MRTTPCTEKKQYAFDNAPRCGAKARTNNHLPCRNPAVRGKKRCRMHGGKGSGASNSNTNALKHGLTTTATKILKSKIKTALSSLTTT